MVCQEDSLEEEWMGLLDYLSKISICKKKKGRHGAAAFSFVLRPGRGGQGTGKRGAWPLFRFPLQGTRPAKGNPPSAEEVDAYLHCFLKSQGKGLLQVDMGFS